MTKKKGKKRRFTGGPEEATKPDHRLRKKLSKPVHAHDDFEIDIEGETEITAVNELPYTGAGVVDDQQEDLSAEDTQTVTDRTDMDLELPRSSGDEVLPVFMSSKKQFKPSPKPDKPPPQVPQTPIPPSDKQDILDLFDDPDDASLSVELPPVHSTPPTTPAKPAAPSSRTVDKVEEFQILRADEDTGVKPLDGDQFESRRTARKHKERKWLGPAIPPPMAHSEQIVSRRFKFTLRDLVLVVLILIIAAGLVLGWIIYQDYLKKQEMEELDRGRALIENTKTEAILETAPEKEADIPYKSKIDTPKGGSSGNKKK